MATNLYQVLEIEATATPEEIRKAYKKKALKTHPDRLPPTATQAEKKASEEQFRLVNQAYEILIDTEKRKEYDFHGAWPPPGPEEIPRASGSHSRHTQFNNDPFSHPFFHNHSQYRSFSFTDPFALFDTIFSDFGPRRSGFGAFSGSSSPFFGLEDPFDRFARLERDLAAEFYGPMSFSSPFSLLGGLGTRGLLPPIQSFAQPMSNDRSGAKWMSETYSSQSINGVTQTVHRRRDWDGNEHVTYTYPDGREVYTINGVEQSRGQIQNTQQYSQLPPPQSSSRQAIQYNSSTNPPYENSNRPVYPTPSHPLPSYHNQANYNMNSLVAMNTAPEVRRHSHHDRTEQRRSLSHSSHRPDPSQRYPDLSKPPSASRRSRK